MLHILELMLNSSKGKSSFFFSCTVIDYNVVRFEMAEILVWKGTTEVKSTNTKKFDPPPLFKYFFLLPVDCFFVFLVLCAI